MSCGPRRPPLPLSRSAACSGVDGQAFRSLGTGSQTSKQNQQAGSPTREKTEGPPLLPGLKSGHSHRWGLAWLHEAPPGAAVKPVSMVMGLLLQEGELCPLYLPDTLSRSATASLGSSTQPKTRHKLPETALQGPQTAILVIITVRTAKVERTQ